MPRGASDVSENVRIVCRTSSAKFVLCRKNKAIRYRQMALQMIASQLTTRRPYDPLLLPVVVAVQAIGQRRSGQFLALEVHAANPATRFLVALELLDRVQRRAVRSRVHGRSPPVDVEIVGTRPIRRIRSGRICPASVRQDVHGPAGRVIRYNDDRVGRGRGNVLLGAHTCRQRSERCGHQRLSHPAS